MSHPPADRPAHPLAGGDLARLIARQIAQCPHPAPLEAVTDDADAARCRAALVQGLWRMVLAPAPAVRAGGGGDTARSLPGPDLQAPFPDRSASRAAGFRRERGTRAFVPGADVPAVPAAPTPTDAAEPCRALPGRVRPGTGPCVCAG